jgi:hypothetical protein
LIFFHGVVVSATLAGTRYVILIRLVRIYADETLPEVELELLHVLENLLSSSRMQYDCCMQPPSSDDTWIDVGGRPAVPLFDDLRDDDWMDRCASFDAASATSFVRQYVDSTVSIAQAGENAPAQRSEDICALQAVTSCASLPRSRASCMLCRATDARCCRVAFLSG